MHKAQSSRSGRGHSFRWPSRPWFLTVAVLSIQDILPRLSFNNDGWRCKERRKWFARWDYSRQAPGDQAGKATRQRIFDPNRKVIYPPVLFPGGVSRSLP